MASVMLRDWIKERRRDRQWINIKRAGIALFFLVGLVYYTLFQAQINGLRLMPRSDVVGIVRISGNIMNDSGASARSTRSPSIRSSRTSAQAPVT